MWDTIVGWFNDFRERRTLLRNFNQMSRQAFINGYIPTLLEARVTIGCSDYSHANSRFMAGGFRIKVISGRNLNREELIGIGRVVLDDRNLVRQLIVLGWDTLEVHDNMSTGGLKWELRKHGGMIELGF